MQTSSTLFLADLRGKTVDVAVYTMDGKVSGAMFIMELLPITNSKLH
jgi:hypothetical protein